VVLDIVVTTGDRSTVSSNFSGERITGEGWVCFLLYLIAQKTTTVTNTTPAIPPTIA
jgi:hypothetical protein